MVDRLGKFLDWYTPNETYEVNRRVIRKCQL